MDSYLSEQKTRQQLIDKQLSEAGWGSKETTKLEEHILGVGVGEESDRYADYVLLDHYGKPLAIIEAKKTTRDELSGKNQAADYADAILNKTGFDPFIFLTNGKEIQFWDRGRSPLRKVSGFHSQADLQRLKHQREYGEPFTKHKANPDIAGYAFQQQAVRKVTENIEAAERTFLVVMATGTGKTRTTISLIDIMMRAKRAQRILFLADRRELVKQAIEAIKEHLPNRSVERIEAGSINAGAKIHVSTYPSMMRLYRQLSVGYYDLIIADESHRSIYNRYKAIFDRFDAVKLGLTATPTDYIDHNTFDLFGCTDGVPSFNYSFQEAIDENYLVKYRVLQSQTNFQLQGIKGEELPEKLQKQLLEQGLTPEEIYFEGTEIEKSVINKPTNLALVREFMEKCRKDVRGRPLKSIIFATSHNHAKRIWECFNTLYASEQKHGMAEIIDSHMERAEQMLDSFKNKDLPRIAISVDMLDTGIDVPAIQNLLFAKPVFSKVKFWQMIGRGTRKFQDPISGEHKKDFLIIDCWNNFERFRLDPEGEIPNPSEPLPTKLFRLQLEKLRLLKARGEDEKSVVKRLQRALARLPKDNINIRPHLDHIDKLTERWPAHSKKQSEHLSQVIAPLMMHDWDMPLSEMRFRTQVERYTVAWLQGDAKGMAQEREKICSNLMKLADNIREVKAVAEQRAWMLSDGFWDHIDQSRLQELQDIFAPLMKYRQSDKSTLIELNLPDKIESRNWIIYGPTGEGAFVESYREQVEAHVRQLASESVPLMKLRRGEDLNELDLAILSENLNQADLFITEETLQKAYRQPVANLADFLKHILELSKFESREEQITNAFNQFITDHEHLTSSQINFLRGIRSAVIKQTLINRQQLMKPPLSRVGNVENLFTQEEIEEVIEFANQFSRDVDAA